MTATKEAGRRVGNKDSRGKDRVQTVNDLPSETIQSDAHLADIRNILQQYGAEGLVKSLDEAELEFRDVTEFTDLADAMNQAAAAEVQFMKLPSKVREIFGHDVAVWLDTAHDKDKRDELAKAGFIKIETDADQGGEAGSVEKEAAGEAGASKGTPEGSE